MVITLHRWKSHYLADRQKSPEKIHNWNHKTIIENHQDNHYQTSIALRPISIIYQYQTCMFFFLKQIITNLTILKLFHGNSLDSAIPRQCTAPTANTSRPVAALLGTIQEVSGNQVLHEAFDVMLPASALADSA